MLIAMDMPYHSEKFNGPVVNMDYLRPEYHLAEASKVVQITVVADSPTQYQTQRAQEIAKKKEDLDLLTACVGPGTAQKYLPEFIVFINGIIEEEDLFIIGDPNGFWPGRQKALSSSELRELGNLEEAHKSNPQSTQQKLTQLKEAKKAHEITKYFQTLHSAHIEFRRQYLHKASQVRAKFLLKHFAFDDTTKAMLENTGLYETVFKLHHEIATHLQGSLVTLRNKFIDCIRLLSVLGWKRCLWNHIGTLVTIPEYDHGTSLKERWTQATWHNTVKHLYEEQLAYHVIIEVVRAVLKFYPEYGNFTIIYSSSLYYEPSDADEPHDSRTNFKERILPIIRSLLSKCPLAYLPRDLQKSIGEIQKP